MVKTTGTRPAKTVVAGKACLILGHEKKGQLYILVVNSCGHTPVTLLACEEIQAT